MNKVLMNSESRLHNQSNSTHFSQSGFNSTSERFLDYDIQAKKTHLGPGQYNDQKCFQKLRNNKCKTKMKMTTFGKQSGEPYYVQVGNAIMIDPTFFDSKTKKFFHDKSMRKSQYNMHQKDLIVQKLTDLQKLKQQRCSSQGNIEQRHLQLSNSKSRFFDRSSQKRPSSQLSFIKNSTQVTPKQSKLSKMNSKSSLLMNQSQRSSKNISIDQSRAYKNDSTNNSLSKQRFSNIKQKFVQVNHQKTEYQSNTPQVLIEKKQEIMNIIQQSEDSLLNNHILEDSSSNQNDTAREGQSRMNRSFAENKFNSQSLPQQSVLVMRNIQGDESSNINSRENSQLKSNLLMNEIQKQGVTFYNKSQSNGVFISRSASTNTSQYGFNNESRRSKQLSVKQTSSNLNIPSCQPSINSFKQNYSSHRKSNSLYNNFKNNPKPLRDQISQRLDQSINKNDTGKVVPQRMRDFDQSFYFLKMYANPYNQKQRVNLQGQQKQQQNIYGSNQYKGVLQQIRKVNTEAVNWSRQSNNNDLHNY